MRLCKYPIGTFKKEDRNEESKNRAVSHELMLRAGYIKRLAPGVFIYLPPMLRVLQKTEQIIREEMNISGAIELQMPVLCQRELWEKTGRWDTYREDGLLFHLKDRKNQEMLLGPTQEEVITWLASQVISSHNQLPVNFYQINTKFRDELRPQGGLNRSREFPMKDAYSFDKDQAGLDASYDKMVAAYIRVFKRCGLEFLTIEADSGAIGGAGSQEFMVRSDSGEDKVITCDSCNYAANIETAVSELETPQQSRDMKPLHEEHTPGSKTVDDLVALFPDLPHHQMVKTILYEVWLKKDPEVKVIAILMRGDLDINETKLGKIAAQVLKGTVAKLQIACPETVERVTNAEVGFAGPINLNGAQIVADESVRPLKNFLCGNNKTDYHVLDVNYGRDFPEPLFFDLRNVAEGEACSRCNGGKLQITPGIEIGHVFKLGTKYSQKPSDEEPTGLSAMYQDEKGDEQPLVMGCYGIGVTRIPSSAIELHHDENGMIWPISIAPWHVVIVPANMDNQEQVKVATQLYEDLIKLGVEAVLDDREGRIGFKLNDADLMGYPYKVIVGKALQEKKIELKNRANGYVSSIGIDKAAIEISQIIQKDLNNLRLVD